VDPPAEGGARILTKESDRDVLCLKKSLTDKIGSEGLGCCHIQQLCPTKIFSVATFTTFVATDSLLSPQLREMCCKKCNLFDLSTKRQLLEKLPVATFRLPVATCGWPATGLDNTDLNPRATTATLRPSEYKRSALASTL
jgi:hypothetical protein